MTIEEEAAKDHVWHAVEYLRDSIFIGDPLFEQDAKYAAVSLLHSAISRIIFDSNAPYEL